MMMMMMLMMLKVALEGHTHKNDVIGPRNRRV